MHTFRSLLTIAVLSCTFCPAWADPDDPLDEPRQVRPDAADGSLLRPEMQPRQEAKEAKETGLEVLPAVPDRPESSARAASGRRRPSARTRLFDGAGASSKALQFDGTSTYVDLGSALDFSKDSAFSVSFWMNSTGMDQQMIVGKGAGFLEHSAPGWTVFTANGGFLYFQLNAASKFRSSELQAWELNTRLCDARWHHVVVSYNGNQDLSGVAFYIDGAAQTLGTDSNNLRTGDIRNQVDATLGATAAPSGLYRGALHEMQIFDRALTAADAAKLYADGRGSYGAAGVSGLAAGYHLDEGRGTTVADFSGHGNEGTLHGGMTWVAARGSTPAAHDHALHFDGARYATLPQSTKFTSGDFTISLWFYPTTDKKSQCLFMRGFAYRELQGDICLKINPKSGNLDFQSFVADPETSPKTASRDPSRWLFGWDAPESRLRSAFNYDHWNHVVVTRRGDTYAMWMNGERVGSEHSPADISDTDNTNPFIVGGMMHDDGVGDRFQGALDEFRIFHRCLSDLEISALYNGSEGQPIPDEVAVPITPPPAAVASPALHFDGQAGSFVEVPNLDMNRLTFATWVKRDVTMKKQYLTMCEGYGGWGVYFSESGDNNYLWLTHRGAGGWHSNVEIANTQWHFVAVTLDGNSLNFYVDGKPAGNADMPYTLNSSGGYCLGGAPEFLPREPGCSLQGSLAQTLVFSRPLGPAEIAALYNDGRKLYGSAGRTVTRGYTFDGTTWLSGSDEDRVPLPTTGIPSGFALCFTMQSNSDANMIPICWGTNASQQRFSIGLNGDRHNLDTDVHSGTLGASAPYLCDGVPHTVVIRVDDANRTYFYVDGKRCGSGSRMYRTVLNSFALGAVVGGVGQFYQGTLADVAIWNVDFGDSAATAISSGAKISDYAADLVRYWTLANGDLSDRTGGSEALIVRKSAVAGPPPGYEFDAVKGYKVSTSVVRDRGLVAGYRFDEGRGTTAHDFSGHGNDGTLRGGVTWVSGRDTADQHPQAMQFDGTRYATLPQSTKFTSGDFTISLWFDPATDNRSNWLFMRGFGWHDQRGDIGLMINPHSGDLDFVAASAYSQWILGWDVPESRLRSAFRLKEWNHVVVTRRGDTYTMWMNGVRVGSERSSADISDTDDTNPFIVGGFMYDGGVRQMFQGALDEFRIFRRCLSDTEVAALDDLPRDRGKFTIIAPKIGDDDATFVGTRGEDESAKIDLAAILNNDESGAAGAAPRWSEQTVTKTPDGQTILGRFHNQTVTLTLDKLPKHAWVRVRGKLYMQGTWDGSSPLWGPDLWSLSARGGPRLIFASFCNMGYFTDNNAQSYPDDYPTATHPAWTGAVDKLPSAHHSRDGKQTRNDGVYDIDVVFPHAGSRLQLDFSGIYDDPEAEQAWGLGDVQVSVAAATPTQDASILPRLWDELGGADSVRANAALWQFVGAGDRAIAFLSEKVQAVQAGSAKANSLQMRRAHRVARIVGGESQTDLCFRISCLFERFPPPEDAAAAAKPAPGPSHAGAMQFDGTRYATLPQSTKFTSDDFTISLWFEPTKGHEFQYLFMRGFAFRDQQGDICLKINRDSGDLDFQARTSDAQWLFGWDIPESRLRSAFNLNEWNHVVVTRRGDTYTMWMNGVKVGSEHSAADISDMRNTNPFVVGGIMADRGVDTFFQGALDQFRIFHRCLSDGEIAALYDGSDDGKPIPGEVAVPITPPSAADASPALHFDGQAGSRVVIPNLDMNRLTFATWVKRDVISKKQYMIMSADNGGWGVYFSELPVAGEWGKNNYVFFTHKGAGGGHSDDEIADTQWHFVAVALDRQSFAFYIDGKPAGRAAMPYTINSGDSGYCLGGTLDDPGSTFSGCLAETLVFDRALGPGEIAMLYNQTRGPKRDGKMSGLVAGYHFHEGQGTTVGDFSGHGNDGTLHGGVEWTQGIVAGQGARQFGGAVVFDGTDYFGVGNPSDNHLDLGATATIETWVRFDALPSPRAPNGNLATLLSKDEGPYERNKWIFGYAQGYAGIANATVFHICSPETGQSLLKSNPWTPVIGQWYHLAVVKNGNQYTFWRNGMRDGMASATSAVPRVNFDLSMGQCEGGFRLQGALSDLRLWNTALTADQVRTRMNKDLSGGEAGLVGHWFHQAEAGQSGKPGASAAHAHTLQFDVLYHDGDGDGKRIPGEVDVPIAPTPAAGNSPAVQFDE